MSVVRRLRRAVGDTARAIPLARAASARVAKQQYEHRVHRFLVEKSGLADPRPDDVVYETTPARADAAPGLAVADIQRSVPKRHRGRLTLAGGRLFSRDDILDVLEAFRTQGYRCESVATDGTGLSSSRLSAIEQLAERGAVGHVSVSADQLAAAGDRREAGVGDLAAAAQRPGTSLRLLVTTTVRAETLESLPGVADVAAAAGRSTVALEHLMFATPDEVDETLRMIGERDPALIATCVTHDPGISPARVRVQVGALRQRCRARRLPFDQRPVVPDAVIDDFYTPGARLDGRCLYPFLHASVSFAGTVLFCPFIRVAVGDLATQSLEEAWNAPRYTALRKALVEQQLFPVCRRCGHAELTGTPLPQPVRVFTAPLPAMAGNV